MISSKSYKCNKNIIYLKRLVCQRNKNLTLVLDYGALKINVEYRSVESNGELVQLTNYEFEILYLLAKNPGRIFSKEQIYTQVWKEPYYGAEDNVMGIIRRIRKKIEPDSAKPRYILNVWGMGYKFNGELMK